MKRRLVLALLLAAAAFPVRAEIVNARGGLAIEGYDPVAYFAEGRARRGAVAYFHDWRGARWLFVSGTNRDAFAADPARYAPRYGGYCAYGMAQGYKAPIVPEAWSIVDGRLYLNYSRSVQRTWLADVPGYIAKAEANWPGQSTAR
ncbi:unnamed protein product [Phaeothamnion confervicola]